LFSRLKDLLNSKSSEFSVLKQRLQNQAATHTKEVAELTSTVERKDEDIKGLVKLVQDLEKLQQARSPARK